MRMRRPAAAIEPVSRMPASRSHLPGPSATPGAGITRRWIEGGCLLRFITALVAVAATIMRARCARVHASGRGEHVDRDDLAYPARRALVAGGDEAERHLLRVERGAVAAIGEQHRAVVHRRI